MRVLIYTQYWKKGGIERLIKYLVDNLSGAGSNYAFSILTEDVPSPGEQYDLGRQTQVFFRKFSPFDDLNKSKMLDFVRWVDPDVVVTMGSNRSLSRIPLALSGTTYPVVISEHNCRSEMLRKFQNDLRFLNSVRYLADINHFIFEEFCSGFERKESVRVVSNPICRSEYKANAQSSVSPKIVHIGRFQVSQKQQDVLVKSFALIAEDFPDWKLELYGGDWFGAQSKIKVLINELGLSERVFLKGETDRVEEVLSDTQVFAFPSSFEGFGLVVGEALSVGVPVVAFSRCEGVNKLVRNNENGLLVDGDVKDHHAFAEGLRTILANPELRATMSEGAVRSIANFSLDAFLDGWRSIFEDAYATRGQNRLASLSDMEQDYIALVASGRLFDEKSTNNRRLKRLNRIKKLLKDLYIWPLVRFVYRRFFK